MKVEGRHFDYDSIAKAEELELLIGAVEDYAIFLLSPTGDIRSWNRGAEKVFGYVSSEVLGRHFSLFYGTEDLAAQKPRKELEIAATSGRVEDEGWRVRKDGTLFWADTVITVLRDNEENPRGFAKITRDLTGRRRAEEDLRSSHEIFELLVSSVKDYAIFLLDPQGNIMTWNRGAQAIKGYSPSEIIGRHFSVFYTEEDIKNRKPARELEIAKAEGSVEDVGWRLRKDGTRFWANVVITAVYDPSGRLRGFAKVTRDITERKRAEDVQKALIEQREARIQADEERRRAETAHRIALEANRAKDEFLMTLSHELRTPMTSILGWSRLLPSISPQDPAFRDAVESIGRSAQLQARLIDDVLDVSRIISGKLRLSLEAVDPGQLLAASVESVRPAAAAKEISIELDVAPDIGPLIADAMRLQQIVWNLLTNAVKFTPKGGSVRVVARRRDHTVEIRVMDTGEGIDAEFLPHMFEAFRQAENSSTRVHGGLGLGLSIVRYLIEAHGGRVTAESEGRGRGATFSVTLPSIVRESDDEDVPRPPEPGRPPVPSPEGRLPGVKILIVDDDAGARALFFEVLRQAGAVVRAVESAELALSEFVAGTYDVVLSDIAMPVVDGDSLLREIRETARGAFVKVIAISAFPRPAAGGAARGFDLYLTKPIEPAELVDAIVNVLRRES